MFKVKACSCKYISQYAGSKDKKVLAKVKEERLIKDFLDDGMISTRESVLRETAYPDSLKHIELHNRGALVHVTDAVFLFFVQLEICCKRILKKNLITMHNKDAVSVARNLMKNDFSVKRAWESMFQNKVTKAIGGSYTWLRVVQSFLYDMAGAKRHGATTFFELVQNYVNGGQLVYCNYFKRGKQIFLARIFLFHRPCHRINFALSIRVAFPSNRSIIPM